MCRRWLSSGSYRLAITEKGQQRTWDYIPKRNCMWEKLPNPTRERWRFPLLLLLNDTLLVEMRNTCQVTNQSSHGELSFHHNPHLRLCWGLGLFTSRVVRSGGSRLKNAALPTYCHCCEFCALKQKPGVLLENKNTHLLMCLYCVGVRGGFVWRALRCVAATLSRSSPARVCPCCMCLYTTQTNPNCRPYSSPHQVPKHRMLWYIEKGTLREVGKIDA